MLGFTSFAPSPASAKTSFKTTVSAGTTFDAQALGQSANAGPLNPDRFMEAMYGSAFDPQTKMINGQAFQRLVADETASLSKALASAFATAGISDSNPIGFDIGSTGQVELKGDHPDMGKIKALLDENPDLSGKIRANNLRQHEAAMFDVGEVHANRIKTADTEAEMLAAWRNSVAAYDRLDRTTGTTFAEGQLQLGMS